MIRNNHAMKSPDLRQLSPIVELQPQEAASLFRTGIRHPADAAAR
jgi:hypothetical protein